MRIVIKIVLRTKGADVTHCLYILLSSQNKPKSIDETYPHTIAGWAGFIHPDHRKEIVVCHEQVVKERTSFDHEYK